MDSTDSGLPGGNAPAHWYDTWDRQTSQTFSTTTKGLRNAPGENNCFLNSAVQVFWHIDVFRRSYRRLSGHLCMGHSCIFCALKVIFTQFQYSDQSSLQPSALRKALANTFEKQERFQLGHMDDAAECFENILMRIHYHIANTHHEDTCNAAHCIPHQKFAMTVCDQLVCPCGATSEPLKFHEMVHYISANALVSQARMMQESGDVLHPSRFGLLLRNAGAIGNVRDCPGNCGKRVQIRRTLTNVPDVVSIGLVWGSDKPDPELTTEVARNIGTALLLPDIFHSVMCNDVSKLPRLHLTSVVCYYGKHYSTFVWHTKLQAWIYFDDATVRQVGTDWDQVVEKIVRSRYQPLLLIYTNLNASPVSTDTAPSTRVMAPGYSMNPEKNLPADTKPGPDKVKRSLKSDVTGAQEVVQGDLQRKSSFEHRRQSSFLLAVTKQKHKEEQIYAVPHNNSKVVNLQKDPNTRGSSHNFVPGQGSGFSDIPEGQDVTDGYNYTLSNNDQYRRPGLSNLDPNKLPLTQNFSRVGEAQRKDSFKKGKGSVPADIIRYQADPARRSSVSSESDQGSPAHNSGNFVSDSGSNKPALPAKPKHFRTRSQSYEENLADSANNSNNNSQHKVVKPVASGTQMFENADSITRAHTPVQSGLATLPRKKKTSSSNNTSNTSSSSSQADNRPPGSQPSMAANYQYDAPPPPYSYHNNMGEPTSPPSHSMDTDVHSRQSSSSSILSQGTVIDCYQGNTDNTHYRQSSSASQDTLTDKPKEKSKSKKDKEEKKKEERKQRKEEKKQKPKKDKSAGKPPPLPEKQGSARRDEGFSEDPSYIDRRMVESVLSFQKLQRSGSCLSHTSNSSMDSDVHSRSSNNKDTSTEIPFDAASLDSHKDSGYGSSDRNSSSSTGSITMNPYEQYFLSRSMIPPKTFNYQVMAENMRKFMDQGSGMNGLEYTQESDLKSLIQHPQDHHGNNVTVGYVQAHPSYIQHGGRSVDDGLVGMSKEQKDKYMVDAVSGRNKGTPQLPNYQNGQTVQNGQSTQQNQFGPPREGHFQPQGQQFEGHQPQGHQSQGHQSQGQFPQGHLPRDQHHFKEENEQFLGLCQKAEDFMDSCVLAETSERYSDALSSCQQAIDQLKIAMRLQNIGQSSYTFAQKKSNSCLLKSRSLQKKLMYSRQESNASTASSDSPVMDNRASRNLPPSRSQYPSGQGNETFRPPSRSSSQTSVDSIKEGSITSSASGRSNTPLHDKEMRPPIEERVPPMHGHSLYGDRSFETNAGQSSGTNTDFGTMPRWKTQKSQEHTRMCNNQKYEDEVYQDFIDNQRRQNAVHSRTNSGAITPVNELDYVNSNLHVGPQQGYPRQSAHSAGPTGPPHSMAPKPTVPSSQVGTASYTGTSQHGDQTVHTHTQHINNNTNITNLTHNNHKVNNVRLHNDMLNTNQSQNTYTPSKSSNTPKIATVEPSTSVHTAYSYPVHSSTTIGQCMEVIHGQSGDTRNHRNLRGVGQSPGPNTGFNPHVPRRPLTRSTSFTKPTGAYLRPGDKRTPDKPKLGFASRFYSGSQPDLSKLKSDSVHQPTSSSCGQSDTTDSQQVSVRDLKSRFEKQDLNSDRELSSQNSTNGHSHLGRVNSEQLHSTNQISTPPPKIQRQRSKSESERESRNDLKPKSVLTKRGKTGERMTKPRKSVTFSADICLEAGRSGTGSNDNGSVSTGRDDGDSTSSGSPVEIVGDRACLLCHKLGVEVGQSYCEKCTYYMSRFAPS